MSFVYILQSQSSGGYYAGISKNPDTRVLEHNASKTKSTCNRGPWAVKFKQKFLDMSSAKKIETRLKNLKRRDYLEKIIKDGYIRLAK